MQVWLDKENIVEETSVNLTYNKGYYTQVKIEFEQGPDRYISKLLDTGMKEEIWKLFIQIKWTNV